MVNSRIKIMVGVLIAVLLMSSRPGMAQDPAASFPAKPIKVICGAAAGSAIDVLARQLAKGMEKSIGKAVFVENKAGGSAAESLLAAQEARADGHTLVTVTATTLATLAGPLKGKLNVTDFDFLVQAAVDPFVLTVRADGPYKTLQDLIKAAKAHPGKLKVAGFGTGSIHHIAMLAFQEKTGTQFSWVACDGTSEITNILGGHVDVSHLSPSSALQHVKAGKLRCLATSNDKRILDLPDTPSYKEEGIDLEIYQWRGLAARAGIPKPIKEKLLQSIVKAKQGNDFQNYLKRTNQEPGKYVGDEFQKIAIAEFDRTAATMKALGLVK